MKIRATYSKWTIPAAVTIALHGVIAIFPVSFMESDGTASSSFVSVSFASVGDSRRKQKQDETEIKKKSKSFFSKMAKKDPLDEASSKAAEAQRKEEEKLASLDLRNYGKQVYRTILRAKRHMRAASRKGHYGKVVVRIKVNRTGELVGTPTVAKTSGNLNLDKRAIDMVRYAAPYEKLPDTFTKDTAVIVIPIKLTRM